jgi:hypothetical protein
VAAAVARDPRQDLPPVELDELPGDVDDVERQHVDGVIGPFDGQVGEGHEKRELVGRRERSLRQDALDLDEEFGLGLWIGDHGHGSRR